MDRVNWSEDQKFIQIFRRILSEPSIEQWVEDVCKMEREGRFKRPTGQFDECNRDYYRAEDLYDAMDIATKLMTRLLQLSEFSKTHRHLLPPPKELGSFASALLREEIEEESDSRFH